MKVERQERRETRNEQIEYKHMGESWETGERGKGRTTKVYKEKYHYFLYILTFFFTSYEWTRLSQQCCSISYRQNCCGMAKNRFLYTRISFGHLFHDWFEHGRICFLPVLAHFYTDGHGNGKYCIMCIDNSSKSSNGICYYAGMSRKSDMFFILYCYIYVPRVIGFDD